MTDVMPELAPRTRGESPDVRPFRVSFPDADLTELRRRVKATRWPDKETVSDATQGVQLATVQKLSRYWSTEHDWRKIEARLNALPNFITTIDGLDIHFIHVRSKHENALPVIITHGWPGSVIEQLKVVDLLANPTAHGASASDAFHVVIPSLPGYGFSAKPTAPGWESTADRARVDDAHETARLYAPYFYKYGLGYSGEMSLRPQTLYGIADSPVGLAAWMLDHDAASYALIARVFDGQTEGLTRDDVLDNVTLYWLTNTAISSARLYWDNQRTAKGGFFDVRNVQIPVAVMAFPDELYQAPRSWVERAYPKLLRYSKLPKGGHFAAWEQPDAFSRELRLGFESLRT